MIEQNMHRKSFLITICMAMGFMISPLSLVILGNGVGLMGRWLLWLLPLIVLVNFWTAHLYARFFHPAGSADPKINVEADSKWVLTTLQLSSLVPFCMVTSTLILAMAGYALNEIFLYWFPNLLFSICLLILIVAVNLISPSTSGRLQVLSVAMFMASMLLLLVLGFLNWEKPVLETPNVPHIAHVDWRAIVLVFWLFMAAELAVYHDVVHKNRQSQLFSLIAAFVAAGAIFLLWGQTSVHFVSPERLVDTTVPHSIVARAISGENGRKIMGVAILTGSFASVNTLLAGVTAVMASMGKVRQIPPVLSRKVIGKNTAMLFLSIGILCMLLTGMAGKDITWTITHSAFYVWLISHAAFNVFAFRQQGYSSGKENKGLVLPGILAAMVYVAGAVVLIVTDLEMTMVLFFIAGFILISILTMIFSRLYYKA
jgi:hypothetical protein